MNNQANKKIKLLDASKQNVSNPNILANSSLENWDLGTTFTNDNKEIAPYWFMNSSVNNAGTVIVERISSVHSLAKSRYAFKWTVQNEDLPRLSQRFRKEIAGKQVTVSFLAKVDATSPLQTISASEIVPLGTIWDSVGNLIATGASANLNDTITSTWKRLHTTIILPTNVATNITWIEIEIARATNSALAHYVVQIQDIKVEFGDVATGYQIGNDDDSQQFLYSLYENHLGRLPNVNTSVGGILNLTTVKGDIIFLGGTDTITDIYLERGREVKLIVSNALTFTHNTAKIRMPGLVSFTTTNSQQNVLTFVGLNAGIVICTSVTYAVQAALDQNYIGDFKQSLQSVNHEKWLLCNGQMVSRSTYSALFAIIGTAFGGGDGSTTFALPDCRGRVNASIGQGIGLTSRTSGQTVGAEVHTLSISEMPSHNHIDGFAGVNNAGSFGVSSVPIAGNINNQGGQTTVNHALTSSSGGEQAHNNMQPTIFLGNTFIYAGV